jgi:hypothetical protein
LAVESINTYLVHAGKASDEPPRIGGTTVELEGKLFQMLEEIYSRSNKECDIEICFNHRSDGTPQNPCRDLIADYLGDPTVPRGRLIAERLEKVTTHRSGLGLLFLITGKEGLDHKVVISRFPTDTAILAEEDKRALSVEFLERVFMKRATAYKAAAYQDSSLKHGLWLGRAIDKQLNGQATQLSNYWIAEFLDSDFRTTAAAGTRRLAIALRNAAKKTSDVTVKTEIAAAVTLSGRFKGRRLSIREFNEHSGLSKAAKEAIAREVKSQRLIEEKFQFEPTEFSNQVAYSSVELDSGGTLTAETFEFDKVFHRELIDAKKDKVRFSTEGKVISEKLGKSR